MIGVDWGISSFRAFRLAADGHVLGRRSAPRGILHLAANGFAEALHRRSAAGWPRAKRGCCSRA
jgi:2-dehydro-3-deoxygalactonokinase